MSEPWYRDGLQFSCTRCGACCTGAPGYVWVSSEEIEQIAEFRREATEEVLDKFVRRVGTALSLIEQPNGDCVFYDRNGRGCSIYSVRPRQCRTWPFWNSNLRDRTAWNETCRVCAGAGAFVSSDEIARLASVIRL